MPKKMTEKEIKANRLNSAKSTGPKSPKGKEVVKWNALKHGLPAREIIIKEEDEKEKTKDFDDLISTLRAGLKPEGC